MLKPTIREGGGGAACRTQEARGDRSRRAPGASRDSPALLQMPCFHTPPRLPVPSHLPLPPPTPTAQLGGSQTALAFVSMQDTGICNSALSQPT